MYNAYGNNVLKKYQVNMGNPYQVKPRKASMAVVNKDAPREPELNINDEKEQILEQARLEAQKIIQDATNEAEQMLVAAQDKIMSHMLEVEQKAKEEGYSNGEALARQHYQSLLNEAEEIRQQAQVLYQNTVSSLETEVVETILEISRKVIGMEISQNSEAILSLIRNTLMGTSPSENIIVHVSPEQFEYVQENKDRILAGMKINGELIIKKDTSMEKGGCIVDTGFGTVDGSIETQLHELECRFRELLDNSVD